MAIKVNIEKAQEIAHEVRREKRAEEFKPLDEAITINIANPDKVAEVEAERQAIRDKYAEIQINIDSSTTTDELKAIIESL